MLPKIGFQKPALGGVTEQLLGLFAHESKAPRTGLPPAFPNEALNGIDQGMVVLLDLLESALGLPPLRDVDNGRAVVGKVVANAFKRGADQLYWNGGAGFLPESQFGADLCRAAFCRDLRVIFGEGHGLVRQPVRSRQWRQDFPAGPGQDTGALPQIDEEPGDAQAQ